VVKEFEILIFLKFDLFFSRKKKEYLATGKLPFSGLLLKLTFELLFFSHFWQNSHPKKKEKKSLIKIVSSKIHISSD
jgi:hypothetical protein